MVTKAAAKKKGTSVAKTKKAAISKSYLDQMAEQEGAGMEEMTGRDFALPFIHLLQDLSPQVKKREESYIDGAEPGQFFNSVTETVSDALRVVPVKFQKVYNEWVPRNKGGGFVSTYSDPAKAAELSDPDNEIVDTMNIFCLVQGEFGWSQGIISLTSTKLKAGRKWNSLARMRKMETSDGRRFTPPYYGVIYKLTSVEQSNEKGTFFNIKVEDDGVTLVEDEDLFEEARGFLSALNEGVVGADFNRHSPEDDDEDDSF